MSTKLPTFESTAMALWPTPADLIVSDTFFNRSFAAPSLHSESAAAGELSHILEDEDGVLLRFLEIAQNVCGAGSAGVSALHLDADPTSSIRWRAIVGALSTYEGALHSREFSTCGLCLDNASSLILDHPQRVFAYLEKFHPSIEELLVVPLFADRDAIGTLWLVHHDPAAHFCIDDARIIERLALHLEWALRVVAMNAEHLKSIEFRDGLLRDAHHRVMNTLQIAASVLHAESLATDKTTSLTLLSSAGERLQVLAKVHGMLARTLDESIALPALIRAVVDAVSQCVLGARSPVQIHVEVAPLEFSGDRAIPLALLINEAVTNACKHAFPQGRPGSIRVDVGTEGNTVIVKIADDGIGMSQSGADGFGLRLLRTFAQQLQGSLTVEAPIGTSGTTITLRFSKHHDTGDGLESST